ncbi:TPA: DUF551 domain-containing protein [Citrobacter freundii]
MTTNNHPAHGPVSLERLHQICEILSKAAAQSDGGNLGYAMADAVKVIDGSIAAFRMEPYGYVHKGIYESCGTAGLSNDHGAYCNSNTHIALYTTPPATVVPEPKSYMDFCEQYPDMTLQESIERSAGWNACRAAMLQAGNSPVAPDGWIPVSERMPEGMKTVITSNGFDIGQGWWDGECWKSFDCHDVVPGKVTHWMPLPAAPQQEG